MCGNIIELLLHAIWAVWTQPDHSVLGQTCCERSWAPAWETHVIRSDLGLHHMMRRVQWRSQLLIMWEPLCALLEEHILAALVCPGCTLSKPYGEIPLARVCTLCLGANTAPCYTWAPSEIDSQGLVLGRCLLIMWVEDRAHTMVDATP